MHETCFLETQSVGEFVETRGGEGHDVDNPRVVDYFVRAESSDCYGEAADRVVDISVRSDCPSRNQISSSQRLVDNDFLDICRGHPQIDSYCLTGNDIPWVDNHRHVDVSPSTKATRYPYSMEVDDRPTESDRCMARSDG